MLLLFYIGNSLGSKPDYTEDKNKVKLILAVRVNLDLIFYFIMTIVCLIKSSKFNESYYMPS